MYDRQKGSLFFIYVNTLKKIKLTIIILLCSMRLIGMWSNLVNQYQNISEMKNEKCHNRKFDVSIYKTLQCADQEYFS